MFVCQSAAGLLPELNKLRLRCTALRLEVLLGSLQMTNMFVSESSTFNFRSIFSHSTNERSEAMQDCLKFQVQLLRRS